MIRVCLLVFSFTLAAAERQPLLLFWPQAGIVPPGTNNFPPRDPNATAGPQVNPAGVLNAPAAAVPITPVGAPQAAPPPPPPGARVGPGGIPVPGVPNGVPISAPPQQPGGAPPAPAGRPGTGPPSGGIIGLAPRPGEGILSRNNDSTAESALLISPPAPLWLPRGTLTYLLRVVRSRSRA